MNVNIKGIGETTIDSPTKLLELAKKHEHMFSSPIVAAIVDGKLRELTYSLERDCAVEFMDMSTEVGMKIYLRSLVFLFVKASYDVFPDCRVYVEHSLGRPLL